jgi:hypothetical protein
VDGYQYSDGQFSTERLRDSQDLTSAIHDGYLEVSADGISPFDDPLEYGPLTSLFGQLSKAGEVLNLSTGEFVLPNISDLNVEHPLPLPGHLAYNQDDGYVVFGNGSSWAPVGLQPTIEAFNGIRGEPGQVVMTADGIEVKALFPLIGDDVGWLFNDEGILLVIG